MKSGARVPPEVWDPMASSHATALATRITNTTSTTYWPVSTSVTTSYPTPSTCGTARPTAPTASPPRAGSQGCPILDFEKRCFVLYSPLERAEPRTPLTRPRPT